MGRIKSRYIKRNAKKIYDMKSDEFEKDFSKNKEKLKDFANIPSKKIRNAVVGYITRLKKIFNKE